MNGRRILADLKVTARGYLRNPIALFFSLIFPLILILLFGLIFANTGATAATLYTENFDHASPVSQEFLSGLNQTHLVTVQVINTSTGNLSVWLGQNDNPVGLVIPAGFGQNYTQHIATNVTLYVNPQDAGAAGSAEGAVQAVENEFNLHAACQSTNGTCSPVLGYIPQSVGKTYFTYIDYLVPGLIGFSILTSPMFSMVDVTSSYRKEGIFRQLSLTPLTRDEWLASRVIWYTILTFLAAAIMLGFGIGVFGAKVTISVWMVPFLLVGPLLFVSLGMLAGSIARTPESAAVIGNIITFPMMFLAGTFFPVSEFSPGLQVVAKVLPLYYVIDGMNQVLLFQNYARALTDFVIVLGIAVVFFAAAVYLFRWKGE
ncbi:MAG: ABC transporter permease [Candidatus Thermoplasmatota archaeon]|jgi:ABC-2 type transport system permease protein|nr:ABC transporter permease [Candidatus Thermoplasmatota archaeon]MCL5983280.1 ABC transporter permease [Candidatus Thermoplasmatota archaeon]